MKVYMLDVGDQIYGDWILAVQGDKRVLVDGSHPGDFKQRGSSPSIPDQLQQILGGQEPFAIDLLVVTHCHSDHIGCLPTLIENKTITCRRALVAHEKLGFPKRKEEANQDAALDETSRQVLAALREEPQLNFRNKRELDTFLSDALNLEQRYGRMLELLEQAGTKVVRYVGPGEDDLQEIEAEFADLGLKVLGPTKEHLLLCADAIAASHARARDALDAIRSRRGDLDAATLYRMFVNASLDGMLPPDSLEEYLDMPGKGAALNDQSIVLKLSKDADAVLLTGDLQFAQPEVADRPLEESSRGRPVRVHQASASRFIQWI
jgi:hypothetical protein